MSMTQMVGGLAILLFLAWLYGWAKDKWFRQRGVRIERRAVKSLVVPHDWTVRADVPVPGLGNCDVLITNADDQRYAVEIKSAESAKKVWFSLFSKDEIRKENGQRFPRDHVAQTLAVAQKLGAVPVLWFPKARRTKRFKTRSGVIVVLGSHRALERAIGARGWWWL